MEDSSTTLLDRIDLKILRVLQAEGRLTNAELAARVNVSHLPPAHAATFR
jgi:Lrp/AsnC family transcriptional regulator, leucine-responsive regulatory protein